jgi:MFS family permease
MCDDEFMLDLIKTCPYFGSFLAFICFSYISDNFGRRKTMIISLALATLGSLLIVLSFNLTMVAVGAILAGGGINVSAGIVFYFFGETV